MFRATKSRFNNTYIVQVSTPTGFVPVYSSDKRILSVQTQKEAEILVRELNENY